MPKFIGWVEGGYSDVVMYNAADDHAGGIIVFAHNYGNIQGVIKKITLFVPLSRRHNDPNIKTVFDGQPFLKDQKDQKITTNYEELIVDAHGEKRIHLAFDLAGLLSPLNKSEGGLSRTIFETDEDPNFRIIIRDFSFLPDKQPHALTLPCAAVLHPSY